MTHRCGDKLIIAQKLTQFLIVVIHPNWARAKQHSVPHKAYLQALTPAERPPLHFNTRNACTLVRKYKLFVNYYV